MDKAQLHARKGEEFEDFQEWRQAYEAHKTSAELLQQLTEKQIDPVIVNALTSLWTAQKQKARECKAKYELELRSIENNPPLKPETLKSNPEVVEQGDSLDEEFNKFWNYIDQWASNPIAFTSTSLNGVHDLPGTQNKALESYYIVNQSIMNPENGLLKHILTAEKEKGNLDSLKSGPSQNDDLESAIIENTILKSSIINFKNDFKQHYKEFKVGSQSVIEEGNKEEKSNDETDEIGLLKKQIEDLKNQNADLKYELNEQSKVLQKYQSRWEKLKESAKKRRQQGKKSDQIE
ncbi:hypothetical protein BB560_001685 [Smittium megazygosporum]|uniref:Uncharacterized protein n=1 Tax=Smittium megazygosporum TaxID=133381 RepID=A0A2T9ZH11_9FUNG|nr:hypothetical protein BB560_001685 [Smittium megazygosporum]